GVLEYYKKACFRFAKAFFCVMIILLQVDTLTMDNSLLILAGIGLAVLLSGIWLGYVLRGMLTRKRVDSERKAIRKEAKRIERERSSLIYEMISELSATLNYQRVLETALDVSMRVLSSPNGAVKGLVSAFFLFDRAEGNPDRIVLRVGSARGFTPADHRKVLEGVGGLLGETIESGEAQVGRNIAQDAELSRIVALRSCSSAYCIPLRAGLETYGVLIFAHQSPDFFSKERCELLDIVGHQVIIALQNARLYADLEQEKERMMEIQEEARKKLARDLHDGPTQSVAAIAMRVNFARRLMERDIDTAQKELVKIEELARRTTKEIRHMLFTLRPLVLESKGLAAALESMAEKMRETYDQNVLIEVQPEAVENLEIGKQAVVFYIAEEAVNNARKHAEAAHIWVRLKLLQADIAMLEIQDDGVGFNLDAVDATYDNRGSLGMVNMRERAELVNGFLHIESAEGKGTRIQVVIPLTEDAYDRLRNRRG
ncbi:MAG: GAF domain-containing protein, partial [Anaerolineae bacterium]